MGVTKIKGKYIVGYDCSVDDHVIYKNAEIVYEGNTIIYIGKNYEGHVDETIDVGNSIISPGFIDLNALGDIDHDIVHTECPKEMRKTRLWSKEYFNNRKEFMTAEEEAFKSLYAYSQLILNGITTAMPITSVLYKKNAETYEELEAAAHHAGKLGLRIYLGPSYQSGIDVINENGDIEVIWDIEEGKKGLERAVKFIKEFDGSYDGLVRGALEPERIENQTVESLKETKRLSKELNVPIKLHAAQGLFEYNEIYKKHNMTPVQFLNIIGFLGENVGIPHCHFIAGYDKTTQGSGDDLKILRDTKTTVIHCPLIIGRHGGYMNSFAKYKRTGINLAIGTDTFPPDFFQNIRIASTISKLIENEDSTDSSYADVYRAATLGGAKMLGREDIGRLCEGAKADIIVINLDAFHIGPADDPLRTAIIGASGTDIILSVINGRTVMKDRKIPGVDLDVLKEKAQAYYDKMRLSYLERSYIKLDEETFFNSTFKVIE